MDKKHFIITIDTEGDNLWNYRDGDRITTINTKYLQRFQDLCNKYSFKVTWLTNYEMIMDDDYLSFIKNVVKNNQGELGMHLHAWNNPPLFKLEQYYESSPYLIEYPPNIMEDKIKALTDTVYQRSGIKPITHRAGRWAMNDTYFNLLAKYGYKYDCSYTPYTNWNRNTGATKDSKGSNYSFVRNKKYTINTANGIIKEYPVSIISKRRMYLKFSSVKSLISSTLKFFNKQALWLRPNGHNLKSMIKVVDAIHKNKQLNYLMFMIHSSELMPGGSPTFQNEESIEKLYKDLEYLFEYISRNYKGSLIKDID